jgi:RHS repeat-associated protein
VASFNAKNQAPGWGYDAAGNITAAPGATIGYDAENRQVAFGSTQYVYDGLGNRVQKIDQYNNATTYVYDAFGNLAAEYGGSPPAAGTTQYLTVDAFGSTRLVMSGAQASERHDFQPFGLEDFADSGTWRTGVAGYGVDTVRQKFTGQERDGESYLDFFQARYFSPIQGRFISPDPGSAGANLADPQSWNGYAYVSNNPLTFTDPSGMFGEGSAGCLGGPIGCVVGGVIDVLGALFGLGVFGGGQTDLSGVAHTPITLQPSPSMDWQTWNDPAAADDSAGTGTLFGSGNTGPFTFSFQQISLTSGSISPKVNIQVFVTELLRTCFAVSHGECSGHVYAALKGAYSGQIKTPLPSGGRFGKVMTEVGCPQIPTPPIDYKPKLGDVMVMQPTTKNVSGHVQVWSGSQWASDFIQIGRSAPWPGPTYAKEKPPYAVYRCGN